MPFLEGKKMTAGYGGDSYIIKDCSISVEKGEIAVVVGPNGAGKSTAMKAIFGMIKLKEGNVFIEDQEVTSLSPQDRVTKGMAFVPQTNNIFSSLTVEENLQMGGFIRVDSIDETIEQMYSLFTVLKEKRFQVAGELSGGQRQQVAFARALMTNPKVLMLDEPTAGVSPKIMDEIFDKIIDVSKTGVSILMVEQNAKKALEIADKGFVLVQGKNKFVNSGKELLNNKEVKKAFLGG